MIPDIPSAQVMLMLEEGACGLLCSFAAAWKLLFLGWFSGQGCGEVCAQSSGSAGPDPSLVTGLELRKIIQVMVCYRSFCLLGGLVPNPCDNGVIRDAVRGSAGLRPAAFPK